MRSYFLRRLGYSVITLFILAISVFGLVRMTGDPAVLLSPEGATAEDLAQIRAEIGTDKPLPVQFARFIADIARFDFGTSFQLKQPVNQLYFDRLPYSMLLVSVALGFALILGIPAGIISAVYNGRWMDKLSKAVALSGMSVPGFIVGLILMQVLAVEAGLLPVFGSGSWKHLVMPSIALGWYFAASTLRIVRSSMLDILGTDFVKLARLKGMSERRVMLGHAFRNSLIPLITLTGVNFVVMINAATIVEVVFVWPGLGSLLLQAINQRDFPLVQGIVIMAGVVIIFANFVVDMLYAWVDPRIRLSR
ncbi:MAG: ABC transporter permease [Acidimicrobiia bacterium]|nr:ABC transporter permease [Acidimicrobiia bacterium]